VPRKQTVAPVSVSIDETLLEVQRLVTHLQNAAELKDTALAHELHDDLGGLMGAAVMDLDSVRRLNPALSQNALERLEREKRTLEQAIDLERRVIEDLRPSTLDDIGLFAALRFRVASIKYFCLTPWLTDLIAIMSARVTNSSVNSVIIDEMLTDKTDSLIYGVTFMSF
jgi:signal transduction histidine kinase